MTILQLWPAGKAILQDPTQRVHGRAEVALSWGGFCPAWPGFLPSLAHSSEAQGLLATASKRPDTQLLKGLACYRAGSNRRPGTWLQFMVCILERPNLTLISCSLYCY